MQNVLSRRNVSNKPFKTLPGSHKPQASFIEVITTSYRQLSDLSVLHRYGGWSVRVPYRLPQTVFMLIRIPPTATGYRYKKKTKLEKIQVGTHVMLVHMAVSALGAERLRWLSVTRHRRPPAAPCLNSPAR